MKRSEVLREYDVDRSGRIKSPGKFEGEMIYVPVFWNAGLEGFADDDDGSVYEFRITADDRREYPELGKKKKLRLAESEQGFVYEL